MTEAELIELYEERAAIREFDGGMERLSNGGHLGFTDDCKWLCVVSYYAYLNSGIGVPGVKVLIIQNGWTSGAA